jgi:hypothetical protein
LLRAGARGLRLVEATPIGEDLLLGAAGLESVLGDHGARWGSVLGVEAGVVGDFADLEAIVVGRATVDAPWLALSAQAATSAELADSALAVVRARVGRSDGTYVAGGLEGATERVPLGARRLLRDGWAAPAAPWFDRSGWTAAGELGAAWWTALSTIAALDYDVTHAQPLALRGEVRYRHACACLSAAVWASQRSGRSGFDAGFALDLMP